jgi:hypothetical protein
MRRRLLLGLLLLGACASVAHARSGTTPSRVRNGGVELPRVVRVDAYADCTGTTDATSGLASALTAATGATLEIPSGCELLLASPGAGNAVVTLLEDARRLQRPYGGSPRAALLRFWPLSVRFLYGRRRLLDGVYTTRAPGLRRSNASDVFTVIRLPRAPKMLPSLCRFWANGMIRTAAATAARTRGSRVCTSAAGRLPLVACDSHRDCIDQNEATPARISRLCGLADTGRLQAAGGKPVSRK